MMVHTQSMMVHTQTFLVSYLLQRSQYIPFGRTVSQNLQPILSYTVPVEQLNKLLGVAPEESSFMGPGKTADRPAVLSGRVTKLQRPGFTLHRTCPLCPAMLARWESPIQSPSLGMTRPRRNFCRPGESPGPREEDEGRTTEVGLTSIPTSCPDHLFFPDLEACYPPHSTVLPTDFASGTIPVAWMKSDLCPRLYFVFIATKKFHCGPL